MEIQNVAWTVEDLLVMHRFWITKLYVEESKTAEGIFEILRERGVSVTYEFDSHSIAERILI